MSLASVYPGESSRTRSWRPGAGRDAGRGNGRRCDAYCGRPSDYRSEGSGGGDASDFGTNWGNQYLVVGSRFSVLGFRLSPINYQGDLKPGSLLFDLDAHAFCLKAKAPRVRCLVVLGIETGN